MITITNTMDTDRLATLLEGAGLAFDIELQSKLASLAARAILVSQFSPFLTKKVNF